MPVPALLAQKGARQSVIQHPKGLKVNSGLSISKALENWSKPERLRIAMTPARRAREVPDSREHPALPERALCEDGSCATAAERTLGSTPLRPPHPAASDGNLPSGAARKGLLGQTDLRSTRRGRS